MDRRHTSPAPAPLSTNDAQLAFEAALPELIGIDPGEIRIPRVDVQRSAAVAHSIALRDQGSGRVEYFEQLAAVGLYSMGRLPRLLQLALATWFARQQLLAHRSLAPSSGTIPEPVLRQAQQHRQRMLRVLEYWLDDDARMMEEVAVIRKGTGHLDLANDLEQLADLHQRPLVRAQIEHDTKHVDPSDSGRARALARSIFSGLGITVDGEDRLWSDRCQRAWTLLLGEYEEHRAAGVFLMRAHEDTDRTYPSLIAVVRAARTSTVGEPEPPPPELTDDDEQFIAAE